MRRLIFPLVFGLAGAAILIWLGTWQVQRLSWKKNVLSDIEARIAANPVALPTRPDPKVDQYLPVVAQGKIIAPSLKVLVSQKNIGAGYRIISVYETAGRRVLLDRGFVRVGKEHFDRPSGMVTIKGNLLWPDEIDGYTPEPDLGKNLWFARDIPAIAQKFDTEEILIVAREIDIPDKAITPLPVSITGIPNDHLNYAITWYSLAIVWLAMSGYLIWRNRTSNKRV